MNDTNPKLPPAALLEPSHLAGVPTTKGELIVLTPSLDQLTAAIRQRHREVEAATVDAVASALRTGKALLAAKAVVGHGNFADYVAIECRVTMRMAQNYMRLAKREAEVHQMLANKRNGVSYLTLGQALKFSGTLSKKNSRRKRAKAAI
jgi:hypothetical protein